MSTIKVNKIEHTGTTAGGVEIDSSGHVQVDGLQMPTVGPLSNRNLVINGDMRIAQRGTSESGLTDSPAFVVDRFAYRRAGTWGTNSFTLSQQSSGAPSGFKYFLRLAQSGTAAAPPANTWCGFGHYIEGQNVLQVGLGTSSAQPLTLSFYAKASQAGTYCVQVGNAVDQSFIAECSVTTSWQRFTISIPARTAGTWNTNNSTGIYIHWIISADSDGTPSGSTGWSATNDRYTTNQTEAFASNAGATFDLCGVQLEVGDKATSFEHRSYGDELQGCLRYYNMVATGADSPICNMALYASNNAYGVYNFPVEMRAAPTVDSSDASNYFTLYSGGSGDNFNTIFLTNARTNAVELRATSGNGLSGAAGGHSAWARCENAAAHIALNAEL